MDQREFVHLRDTLTHRGPDGAGAYFDDSEQVALGHRRLAFLDLSESASQPMPNEDGTCWLTFNGEIYNYVELRNALLAKGHRFRSSSDTEVILHGYEEWGTDVLSRLKGMFAFAIYDASRRELFLARDRFGIKPLYYYKDPSTFLFASEIKALVASKRVRRTLRYESLADYLAYRFVPSPWTIWRNVFKVPPAHYLLHRPDGTLTVREYWRPPIDANVDDDRATAVERTNELLEKSVAEHLRSDVPVGAFLSGGYDSSALVHYMARIGYPRRTFAIGFEGWDESEHKYASLVAEKLQAEHTNFLVREGSLGLVEKLVDYYDEPIADISIIPTYLVSQVASRSVKAVLSGEGADEMFCGYTWHRLFQQEVAARSHPRGLDFTTLATERYGEYMAMGRFGIPEIRRLLHPDIAPPEGSDADWWYRSLAQDSRSPVKAMQYLDIKSFMPELVLTKIDRATMAHSLEARVPFLDHELFEYVISLRDSVYFDPGKNKVLLGHILEPVLPEAILNRRKQGFVGPNHYYKDVAYYAGVIREGSLLKDRVIQGAYVEDLIRAGDYWRLWKIMVLEFWYRRWMSPGLSLPDAPQPVSVRRTKSPDPDATWIGKDRLSFSSVLRRSIGRGADDRISEESAPRSYIICASQCSGASLLGAALAQTGLVGNPREYLLCHESDSWSSSPPRWLTNEPPSETGELHRPRTIREFLTLVRARGTRGGAFGMVLMWSYYRQVINNLRSLREFRRRPEGEIIDAAFGYPCFLWLTRRDPLQQAVAWSRATQTGAWSEGDDDCVGQPTAEFRLEEVKQYHREVIRAREGWQGFFQASGVRPLEISYEDLVADLPAVLGRVLQFVGVEAQPAALESCALRPRANSLDAEWASRYREFEVA